jgi:transcriptional regulator with XRE-family HTH domain
LFPHRYYLDGNLLFPMDILFGEWLKQELEQKRITQSDLAQMIGVHPPQVSRIISGERATTPETLISIAHALKLSPITIFRKAGLLPQGPENEIKFEDWKFLLDQLTPEEEEEMRQIAIMKIERHKKNGSLKSLKPKRAGK